MTERLVVLGGDAAGMSAASQARRRTSADDLEIIALEKGSWTSYSACGIPYLVAGDVGELDDLVARTPEQHRANGIEVRLGNEAMSIDLDGRRVEVRDHADGTTYWLDFDILHIATGARPTRPPIEGIDLPFVHAVQTLDHAAHLLDHAGRSDLRDVVVVGGGYIGLEMAEAFHKRGQHVTIVEALPQVMSTLDPDMGALVGEAARAMGIDVRVEERVEGFSPGAVHTAGGDVRADLVVLGLGVQPNSAIAAEAGIETGAHRAVRVDRRQRTSKDGVWAAGDVCESFHRVSRRHMHIALGTVANKQGRVAGINIGGGYASFPGVVGTAVSKLCDLEVARSGLQEREAQQAGFDYVVAKIESTTKAGYFPGTSPMTLKMLAEKRSGRLLGAQIVGREGSAKRIDAIATALTAEMTVEEMTGLDLSYAPPFAPVWDPILVAARKCAELLEGEP
ncbi:MAG: FAD-dependent oxidoreductase [Acidimicrobiia bacterium]